MKRIDDALGDVVERDPSKTVSPREAAVKERDRDEAPHHLPHALVG